MASTFVLVTDSSVDAARLFDISLDIDAHVESMAQTGESAVGGVTAGGIGLGESVTWRARHFGIWFTMTSRVTALERPTRFVDQQVTGPFRTFIHEHTYEHVAGGSRMTDTITVGSPIFGRLVERVILVPYLRRLIAARNKQLVDSLS